VIGFVNFVSDDSIAWARASIPEEAVSLGGILADMARASDLGRLFFLLSKGEVCKP
jgi:hypothetical protein